MDHKPLERISVTHTKMLNQLQLRMQEMHPNVGYLKGGFNTISAFLSRYKWMNVAASGLTSDAGINFSVFELTPTCFKPTNGTTSGARISLTSWPTSPTDLTDIPVARIECTSSCSPMVS